MSGRRIRKRKSRKKLAYGIIAVTSILLCFFVYFSLQQSNQSDQTNGDNEPPQAAIVDHLNFTGQPNPTFVNACIDILDEGGLTWKYYRGEDITVDFYRNLPSYGTSLMILRVHSARMPERHLVGLFTSERYLGAEDAMNKYPEDVEHERLVRAFFTDGDKEYFGIVPKFVEESMEGEFENTIIVMMGCDGLGYIDNTDTWVKYTDMAEAFRKRGAKVYISWNGPVSVNHTDQATVCLLRHLVLDEQNIRDAVKETREEVGQDPSFDSTLKYYPEIPEAENYTLPNLKSSFFTNVVIYTSPTSKAPKKSKYIGVHE